VNTLENILPLAVLGALFGLDVVSFPQAMISRPIVAATVAGALVGAPVRGMVVGAVLELFALETLPFGASRYPEWGSASVVGGALFGFQTASSTGALAIAVCAALVTAGIGGWSMIQHRRLIGRWSAARSAELASGSVEAVIGLQLRGMTADLLRGGILTALALVVFLPTMTELLGLWSSGPAISRAVVIALAGAVATAAVWNVTHVTKGAGWFFFGGLAVGAGLLAAT
jgi:PTS system mannose-specific IIC component